MTVNTAVLLVSLCFCFTTVLFFKIEILGDDFGFDYFNITRSLFNTIIPVAEFDPRVKVRA